MVVYYLLLTPTIDKFILSFLVLVMTYEVSMRVTLTAMVFISDKCMFPNYYFYFPRITNLNIVDQGQLHTSSLCFILTINDNVNKLFTIDC